MIFLTMMVMVSGEDRRRDVDENVTLLLMVTMVYRCYHYRCYCCYCDDDYDTMKK